MLSGFEKILADNSIYATVVLDPVYASEDMIERLKYLVDINKPLFVLRRRGYFDLDPAIQSATVEIMLEYDGLPNSPSYRKAKSIVDKAIRETYPEAVCLDDFAIEMMVERKTASNVVPLRDKRSKKYWYLFHISKWKMFESDNQYIKIYF